MLYLFDQMILPFNFSSTMFVQKSFKFSVAAISLVYLKVIHIGKSRKIQGGIHMSWLKLIIVIESLELLAQA